MNMSNVTIKFPKRIELENGKIIDIERDRINDEKLFFMIYPEKYTDKIAINLIENGFHDATPSIYKGEKYSMSKQLQFPWEIHLRLFDYTKGTGSMYAHIEIARKYFEHLFLIQPSVYEAFPFYKDVYNRFKVVYGPENSIVKKVKSHYSIVLEPPDNLIEWMPMMEKLYGIFTQYKENIRDLLDRIDLELHKK
ncbi:MAG: hypothetical protein QXZ44_04200 [Ferroplasma sp.]